MLTVMKQKSGQIKLSILIWALLRAQVRAMGNTEAWEKARHRTAGTVYVHGWQT